MATKMTEQLLSAEKLCDKMLDDARAEAEAIIAAAKEKAESERADIMAVAEAKAESLRIAAAAKIEEIENDAERQQRRNEDELKKSSNGYTARAITAAAKLIAQL